MANDKEHNVVIVPSMSVKDTEEWLFGEYQESVSPLFKGKYKRRWISGLNSGASISKLKSILKRKDLSTIQRRYAVDLLSRKQRRQD